MTPAGGFTEETHAPQEMRPAEHPAEAFVRRSSRAVDSIQEGIWKRSVLAFLLTLALTLGAIAAINYTVNPLGIYAPHRFEPMVWNGRAEKVAALRHESPPPAVLVLGSSHVWALAPATLTELTGLPAFNAGVSVAMTEDGYAILRYAVDQAGLQPSLVLLGLDVEALHNNRPVDTRSQDVPELRPYLPRTGRGERVARMKSLETMQSTKLSIRSLRLALRGRGGPPPDPLYTVGAHGDTHLSALERRLASGQINRDRALQETLPVYRKRFDNFTALSRVRLEYLQRTLDFCAQHHIRALVFLMPLHPQLQAGLMERGYDARRRETIEAATQLSAASGASFVDFSDPASFGGSPDGFLDGAHLDQASGALLARALLKETHVIQ